MSSYFGGGAFTGNPNNQLKLRQTHDPFAPPPLFPVQPAPVHAPAPQPQYPQQQQYTQPIQMSGSRPLQVVPRNHVLPVEPPPPPPPAAPLPMLAAPPPRQFVQAQGPMGPVSYPVMKKGEAPCPICRG